MKPPCHAAFPPRSSPIRRRHRQKPAKCWLRPCCQCAGSKRSLSAWTECLVPGKELVLTLKARLDSPRPAVHPGHACDGQRQPLDGTRLINWEGRGTAGEWRVDVAQLAGETFNVPYSPDFDSPNTHPSYALSSRAQTVPATSCRVTDLVPGRRQPVGHRQLRERGLNKTLVVATCVWRSASAVAPRPSGRPRPVRCHRSVHRSEQGRLPSGPARDDDRTGRGRGPPFMWNPSFPRRAGLGPRPQQYFRPSSGDRAARTSGSWSVTPFTNRTAENLPLMHSSSP